MDSCVRNLVHIPQHLTTTITNSNMMGIIPEEPYLIQHLWHNTLYAFVEERGENEIEGIKEGEKWNFEVTRMLMNW